MTLTAQVQKLKPKNSGRMSFQSGPFLPTQGSPQVHGGDGRAGDSLVWDPRNCSLGGKDPEMPWGTGGHAGSSGAPFFAAETSSHGEGLGRVELSKCKQQLEPLQPKSHTTTIKRVCNKTSNNVFAGRGPYLLSETTATKHNTCELQRSELQ